MQRLTDEVKTFIVQQLAMYDGPTRVLTAVKVQFGIELDRQSVRFYDPTRGGAPGKKWQDLFKRTRERFLDDSSDIAVSNRSVRLRRLDRMAEGLEDKGNVLGAAQLLEQAAKEVGGVYTNRRELTGKNGEPLVPDDLTEEERRERVVLMFREAARRRDLAQKDTGSTPAKKRPATKKAAAPA